MRDVRYAARVARRNPGTTISAFVALALGIGATTAIFSVVSHVVLQPLPIRDSNSVVNIFESDSRSDRDFVSMADFLDWKRQLTSFSKLALYRFDQANLSGRGTPERVRILACDSEFLPLLGVAPVRGRNFDAREDKPGNDTTALLSWSFLQTHFGGEDVVGRKIFLDEEPYTVVGILPKGFGVFRPADIWLPIAFDLSMPPNTRGRRWYWALGRLKNGVSLRQANAELATEAASLAAAYPEQNRGVGANAMTLRDALAGNVRPVLYMLLGAGLCVLLIACGNIANLALARATGRQRELSVRMALGASPRSLFRQLLVENVLLSVSAALAGISIAAAAVRALRTLPGTRIPNPEEIQLDWRVLAFAVAIGILTGIGFGLAPAIRASMTRVNHTLKQSSGRLTESRAQQNIRSVFVFLQAAIATFLLIGSVLLIRSYSKAAIIDPGFDAGHILAVHVSLSTPRYDQQNVGAVSRFARRTVEAIRTIPGVTDAAITTNLPLVGTGGGGAILVEGKPLPKSLWDTVYVQWTRVSPEYFQTMRIRRISGRDFDDRDARGARPVVIVNESFVRQFFAGQDPIGKNVATVVDPTQWRQIVGVVADVPQLDIERKTLPEIFFPLAQFEIPWLAIVIRTTGDPLTYTNAIRREVQKIDPTIAVFLPRTMEQIIDSQLGWRVFQTSLVSGFAVIAIVLACIGIYAVVAYSVSQRTAELGIRMALGAERGQILHVVVRQGATPAIFGALAGALCSVAISRVVAQLLYGIEATDTITYLLVIGLFFAIALLASYLPARRAAGLDPSRALRYE